MGVHAHKTEAKGKVAPKAKDKQDEAIIGTNDYSIVSKRSVEKFYYADEPQFLRAFVHKFKRRAPLINRGYWLRMRAVEAVVKRFLDESTTKSKAIVNLGCGYEPLAFRMLWKYPTLCQNVKFVDVDFPALIGRKVTMIAKEPLLYERLPASATVDTQHNSIRLHNQQYCAVACDLGDRELLEHVLKIQLGLNSRSVLFISEVAIVYMPPVEATNAISLCSTFEDARFCLFEQCLPSGPNHPFARTMHEHFKSTPLRGLTEFPTVDSQSRRFAELGWYASMAADTWSIWQHSGFIDDSERKCLDDIEPFDEWEGLALWAGHNFLMLATTQKAHETAAAWVHALIPPSLPQGATNVELAKNVFVEAVSTPRNHGRINGTVMLSSKSAVTHCGGTAFDQRQGCSDLYTFDQSSHTPAITCPENLSFATMTSMANAEVMFIGGRTSPSRASERSYLFSNGAWKRQQDLTPARYRHSAVPIKIGNRCGVLVFGGKTSTGAVLNDWAMFWNGAWLYPEIIGPRPPPTFGTTMAATADAEGILVGGLGQCGRFDMQAMQAGLWCWTIRFNNKEVFELRIKHAQISGSNHSFTRSICRFGATALQMPEGTLLMGGIGLSGPLQRHEECVIIQADFSVQPCQLVPEGLNELPMFVGHSAILASDSQAVMVGGGTVCFSYGSFWNSSVLHINMVSRTKNSGARWRLAADSSDLAFDGTNSTPTQPLDPIKGHLILQLTSGDLGGYIHRETAAPYVLQSLELGTCIQLWDKDYLISAVGAATPTTIHHAESSHLSFRAKNFTYSTVPFAKFMNDASSGKHVYMRALSATKPSKSPACLAEDFAVLARDFAVPRQLAFADEHQHSSVLRISGNVNMWLHYDVMSNILCQIAGSKRIILFPPRDVSKLSFPPAETTSNIDVFTTEAGDLADCSPVETTLRAGEVLFIPACWPHATAPADDGSGMSVAINVFFKSLDAKFYAAGRDVYGNRDLAMYENGRKHIAKLKQVLINAAEEQAVLCTFVECLRDRTWLDEQQVGAKEVNRILASAKDLPEDLALFYLNRLADELTATR